MCDTTGLHSCHPGIYISDYIRQCDQSEIRISVIDNINFAENLKPFNSNKFFLLSCLSVYKIYDNILGEVRPAVFTVLTYFIGFNFYEKALIT